MAVNFISLPIIYLLYPETKGRPLEDMGVLFGESPSSSAENLLVDELEDHHDLPAR